MNVDKITEQTIQKTNCDWIIAQANELKALLQYDKSTILLNKNRALISIETAKNSLEEIRLYIDELI